MIYAARAEKELKCTTRRPAKPKSTRENANLPTPRTPGEKRTETIPRAQPAQKHWPQPSLTVELSGRCGRDRTIVPQANPQRSDLSE